MKIEQLVADVLDFCDGVNATALDLPEPQTDSDEYGQFGSPWEKLVALGDAKQIDWLGKSVEDGEFLAYRLMIQEQPVTLMLFSWSQGGFESVALCDGHARYY